jgi:hypothetical protein
LVFVDLYVIVEVELVVVEMDLAIEVELMFE